MVVSPSRIRLGIFTALLSAAAAFAQPVLGPNGGEVTTSGLKILNSNVVRVVYPYDLAILGTDATVEVSYLVDEQGGATSVVVTRTSNPDAAAAFVAALDEMVFETSMLDGKPALSDKQTLSASIKQMQLPSDLSFISVIKNPSAVVIGVREVDGGLKPSARMAPALFPPSLQKSGLTEGKAVLEFYIDPAGIVRLPKVLSATDPAMGWSAASAVLTWRFEPPKKGGQPAIVKVTGLPVDFKAPPKPAVTPVPAGSALRAEILVESPTIANAQLKVGVDLVGTLPQRILLEVAEDGTLSRDFDLSIRNPNPTGGDKVTLKSGDQPPARIRFTAGPVEVTGTASAKR